jgi:hypothetical protein
MLAAHMQQRGIVDDHSQKHTPRDIYCILSACQYSLVAGALNPN